MELQQVKFRLSEISDVLVIISIELSDIRGLDWTTNLKGVLYDLQTCFKLFTKNLYTYVTNFCHNKVFSSKCLVYM